MQGFRSALTSNTTVNFLACALMNNIPYHFWVCSVP